MTRVAQIIVGDGNPEFALKLAKTLESAGYGVLQLSDGESLTKLAASQQPDLLLMGRMGAQDTDLAIAAKLGTMPETADIPLVLYNARKSSEMRKGAIACGAADLMEGDLDFKVLMARIPGLIRMSQMHRALARRAKTAAEFGSLSVINAAGADADSKDQPARVLMVSEASEYHADIYSELLKAGYDAVLDQSPYRASERLEKEDFALVIATASLFDDREKIAYLISHMRNNPKLFNVPTLVLKDPDVEPPATHLYAQGADVVLHNDRDYEFIVTNISMLLRRKQERNAVISGYGDLLNEKTADPTTPKLHSTAYFRKHAVLEFEAADTRDCPLCVILFQVPSVPRIAAEFGESNADILVEQIIDWISTMLRLPDLISRVGTATFAVMMPFTSKENAKNAAFRITGILEKSEFRLGPEITRSVSIMVDTSIVEREEGEALDALIVRAEKGI